MENTSLPPIRWQALEYERRERSSDWFWGLGLLMIVGSILSLIFGNFLLAIIILLGGGILLKQNKSEPMMIDFEAGPEGIKAGRTFYPYKNLDSFWITTEGTPKLLLESKRSFLPLIDLPLGGTDPKTLYNYLSKKLKAEEHEKSFINVLADWLKL